MDIQRIKQTSIVDLLSRLGHSPVKRKGAEVWYRSPYREERTPSFRVNTDKNLWMDYGTGTGGDIFTLAGEFIHSRDFMAQAKFIAEKSSLPLSVVELPGHDRRSHAEPGFEDVEVQPLRHYALTAYLAERGIPARMAERHCCQLNYHAHGKPYFAVGFKNMAGGYEIRNKFFKGCVPPKDISLVKTESPTDVCSVFEGFMDYLSAVVLGVAKGEDCMVLNSVANTGKAVKHLGGYGRINCYLDNDEAGRRTLETLRRQFGGKVTDCSKLYEKSKDLNDHLQEMNRKRNKFKIR